MRKPMRRTPQSLKDYALKYRGKLSQVLIQWAFWLHEHSAWSEVRRHEHLCNEANQQRNIRSLAMRARRVMYP
jgi:hypothetical protein